MRVRVRVRVGIRVRVRVRCSGGMRGCCVFGSVAEGGSKEQHLGYGWKGGCAAC